MKLEETTNKVKSHHLFAPRDVVRAWHYHYATLVDPIILPNPKKHDWNDIEYKYNEGYKGHRIRVPHGKEFLVIKQLTKPRMTQDHMADVLVASYLLKDNNGLFYTVWSSARLVLKDKQEEFSKNHSFDMSHMIKNRKENEV